jgi:CheY-like chemotaxis protein
MTARVLVTEDDDAVRGVILRVLSHRGYEVIEACHMPEALDRWHDAQDVAPIDLLITDQIMPGGTGQELAQALWAFRPHLPVLFMSGYDEEGATTAASSLVVHLSKPFNTTQLLGHVEHLLRGTRAIPE